MKKTARERRKYLRYDTEAEIYFRVHYSLKTKVEFQLVKKDHKEHLSKKYFGLTKDISAEGLRFSSTKKLYRGNRIYLEMYLPGRREAVCMNGIVRWSRRLRRHRRRALEYDSGVKLVNIMGESVVRSIYFDKKYKVVWSNVLAYAFGSFSKLKQKRG